MFSVTLRSADHIRRYAIVRRTLGWEVTLERDGEDPQQICYRDWHRVERALARFRREVSDLTARGWREVRP
jgi:hypothetical protein